MGYTPYLLTGVYVGFDNPKPMGKWETGGKAALPIWVQYRQQVEQFYPEQSFAKPPGLVMININLNSGRAVPPGSYNSVFLPFKTGAEPSGAAVGMEPSERPADSSQSTGEDLFKQVF